MREKLNIRDKSHGFHSSFAYIVQEFNDNKSISSYGDRFETKPVSTILQSEYSTKL